MNVIALDISKDTADCHLSGNGKEDTLKIDNSISGSLQLLGWIKQHKIRKCVISMEATGIYYETLANHLSQYHQVYVINPLKIKNYSKAFFNRTKTDKADARLIAEYTKRHLDKLDGYHAPEADQYRLHKLIAAKEQIMLQSRQAKNRLHAAGNDEFVKTVYQTIVRQLAEHQEHIEAEIKALVAADERLAEQCGNLETIAGIGEKSAVIILHHLNGRTFATANKFTAYAGLSPKIEQSGISVNKRQVLSNFGNRRLKAVFFLPALNAYRMNLFPQLVRNLEAAKKPKMVIIVAIMRKLAKICYYMHKSGKPFDVRRYQSAP